MKKSLKLRALILLTFWMLLTSGSVFAQSNILFIGNSFTFQGPVPELVRYFASYDGSQPPNVTYLDNIDNVGGTNLDYRLNHSPTLDLINQKWDSVILQDHSSRPTLNGDPSGFKEDVTTLFDLIKTSSPTANVYLYETWARHRDHVDYTAPAKYDSPIDMQQQLRDSYNDAVNTYIPTNSNFGVNNDLFLAPVGDAWERNYESQNAIDLHGADRLHAGSNGYYLNALVLYAKIYNRSPIGLPNSFSITDKRGTTIPYNISPENARVLQEIAFETINGAAPNPSFAKGDSIIIDFGASATITGGSFNNLVNSSVNTSSRQNTTNGHLTNVTISVSDRFEFINTNGLSENNLSYPGTASQDSFATGSFIGHEEAKNEKGQVTINGLNPNHSYSISLFASRSGDDSGRGRLTRYEINENYSDLEVSDNLNNESIFIDLVPNESGELVIDVSVSPDGTGRFAYLGVLKLTSQGAPKSDNLDFLEGEAIAIDFGRSDLPSVQASINDIMENVTRPDNTGVALHTKNGRETRVTAKVSDTFDYINVDGLPNNTLGYPDNTSHDSFVTGSFAGHTSALTTLGQVTIGQLNPNHKYTLKVFASRSGDDSGRGRLTRYRVQDRHIDLEVSDNVDKEAIFNDLVPNESGELVLNVSISPEGSSRFGYLGAITMVSQGESSNECSADLNSVVASSCISIEKDINLQGETINLAPDTTLRYSNGSISNGTLNFSGGKIDGELLNTYLTITGDVQLSDTSVNFEISRWNVVEGIVSDLRATQNTEGLNEAIRAISNLGGTTLIINELNAYFYGRGGYEGRYIYYDKEGALENAILIPSNFHLMMDEESTFLRVQPSNHPADRLIAIVDEDNATISGGNLIGDREDHDYSCAEDVQGLRRPTHEYGALITLQGAHNALIENVKMTNSTGDGISALGTGLRTASGELQGDNRENFNIKIKGTTIDRSRRNNISLTDGRSFWINDKNTFSNAGHGQQTNERQYKRAFAPGELEAILNSGGTPSPLGGKGCEFELDQSGQKIPLFKDHGVISENGTEPYLFPIPNTSGTLPRAGIDLEAYRGRDKDTGALLQYERVSDVHLENNDFIGNTVDLILYSVDHAYIENNRFSDGVHATAAADNISITNNTFIKGNSETNPFNLADRAIFIDSTIRTVNGVDEQLNHDFEISGNTINGYLAGIILSGNNIKVHHNYIKGAYEAITLRRQGENIHLYDNTIFSRRKIYNDKGKVKDTSTGYNVSIANMKNVVIENIEFHSNENPVYFDDGVEKGSTDTGHKVLKIDRYNEGNPYGQSPELTFNNMLLKSHVYSGWIQIKNSKGVLIKDSRIGSNITNQFDSSSEVTLENNTGVVQ